MKRDLATHRVAVVYGLVVARRQREPHDGHDGVEDEREKHVLVKGDPLAAQTPAKVGLVVRESSKI